MTLIGRGIYTFPEAARLTGLRAGRVREWFRVKQDDSQQSLFVSDFEPVDGDKAISFLDLIDVFVAGQLREHGVSLQTLRKVHNRLRLDFDTHHPFSRSELLTDGKIVFLRYSQEDGGDELEEVLTRQKVFPKIIQPFLKRIDYDEVTNLALRWHIAENVVVDPNVCFGKPVIEPIGIPCDVLADEFEANGRDADVVANWFNVHPSYVLAAVKFFRSLAV